jgi:hypothetical protein
MFNAQERLLVALVELALDAATAELSSSAILSDDTGGTYVQTESRTLGEGEFDRLKESLQELQGSCLRKMLQELGRTDGANPNVTPFNTGGLLPSTHGGE